MTTPRSHSAAVEGRKKGAPGWTETRCAVRFPIQIPVVISIGNREIMAVTRNVSASGVLFELGERLKPAQEVQFSLRMPGAVLNAPKDVLVHCTGRVVRCSLSHNQHLAAATIDDYRFGEQ